MNVQEYVINEEAHVPSSKHKMNENTDSYDNVSSETKNQIGCEDVIPKVFLSTGIYIHPLNISGNYENIIELIDVDPDQKTDSSSNDSSNCEKESNTQGFREHDYDFALGYDVNSISNGIIPFVRPDQNNGKLPMHNELQCLQLICNNTSNHLENTSVSTYVDLNSVIQKSVTLTCLKSTVHNCPTLSATTKQDGKIKNSDDDDVVFVESWTIPENQEHSSCNSILKQVPYNQVIGNRINNDSQAGTSTIRRRGRRKNFGEKRKNPIRKAQINKASLDLIEKLAIPASVFNARVKGRRPKQQTITVESKNLRQSCRTSGAIFCPPSPLTMADFKEWPVDGMHERPSYNVETRAIIKYDFPLTNKTTTNNTECLNKIASEYSTYAQRKSESQTTCFRKEITGENKHSQEFANATLKRIEMMFNYSQELKQLQKLSPVISQQDDHNSHYRKQTLYEIHSKIRQNQNGKTEVKTETVLQDSVKNCKTDLTVINMISDACTLCSLAGGLVDKDFIELFTIFNDDEHKN